MLNLMQRLYPIQRSLTGDGNRATLRILNEYIPVQIHEIPTGTPVYDWEIPKEWNVKDAYVCNEQGDKIIDYKATNVSLVGYSVPVSVTISLDKLKEHIYTLPEHPDWIPYITSYYKERWGFCMSHNQMLLLPEGQYTAHIDSSLDAGSLTYGELFLPGEIEDEFLISTYICHPSLCNDNLSGIVLTTFLAKSLQGKQHRYSYRFLFIPETIGAIAWLSSHEQQSKKVKFGLVATCVGDRGNLTYKKTREGSSDIDRIVEFVLNESGAPKRVIDFYPFGSDERQYCSPGFNMPVGSLMRTPYREYPEYHTSADNLDIISEEHLTDTLQKYQRVIEVTEKNRAFVNQKPMCEPRLGKYGLYENQNWKTASFELAILYLLNWSDGRFDLVDIANKSGLLFDDLCEVADKLCEAGLIKEMNS